MNANQIKGHPTAIQNFTYSVSQVKEEDTQSELETTSKRERTNQTKNQDSGGTGQNNSNDMTGTKDNDGSGEQIQSSEQSLALMMSTSRFEKLQEVR